MRKYQDIHEIIRSWRRCMEQNLSTKTCNVGFILSDEEYKKIIQNNKLLVSTFEEVVKDIKLGSCLFLY